MTLVTTRAQSPAISALEAGGLEYRLVEYGEVHSAEEAARARGIPIAALAKTLVVRVEENSYVLVLVPGDRGMDYKKLRAHLGTRRLTMPDPEEARKATGYERGTITPLGAGEHRTIVDERLIDLPEISLGSGIRGIAIHLAPTTLLSLPYAESASVST